MKTVFFRYRFIFFLMVMLSVSYQTKAQSDYLVNSYVRLTIREGDSLIFGTDHFTIISLNDNSGEFSARFSLNFMKDILIDKESASIDVSSLLLTFKGKFPISGFSFYHDQNDTKTYTMNGLLTMNQVSNPYTLYFNVTTPGTFVGVDDELCNPYCYSFFPSRIFFMISFTLSDFGIHTNAAISNKKILVEVGGGVVNRVN